MGFEPTKHIASDLKSLPFDRSGTLPSIHDGIWTRNLQIRSLTRYPIALHGLWRDRIKVIQTKRRYCLMNSLSRITYGNQSISSSRVRTYDLSVNSRALCQLSYRGWYSMRGLNPRPWAHKTHALTNWANGTNVSNVGLEPTTTRLKVLRSTNWAN